MAVWKTSSHLHLTEGFDPEISGLAYPAMKSAVLGINVTF